MGLDYVDIYYHHRPDPETPLEETARALDGIVRSGKALYVGISNYNKEQTIEIAKLFKEMGTPFIKIGNSSTLCLIVLLKLMV